MASCTSIDETTTPRIQAGEWAGGLTPMNHPEMETPLRYGVSYEDDSLRIVLYGPDITAMPAQDAALTGDTLRFSFEEPEENVRLDCALGRRSDNRFEGRCSDDGGKWARFTMIPPSE